jgi:hypothetical protein
LKVSNTEGLKGAVSIDVFLSWGKTKRLEYLVDFAHSIFASGQGYGAQGWLSLYETMVDMQRSKNEAKS